VVRKDRAKALDEISPRRASNLLWGNVIQVLPAHAAAGHLINFDAVCSESCVIMRPLQTPRTPINGRSYSYAAATWLAGKAPYGLLECAAKVGGRIHFWLARNKRRNVLANTSQLVDNNEDIRPWLAFQNHALNILELLKAVTEDEGLIARRLTLHGSEYIDQALAEGNGLILTTAHLGNWELSGLLLAMTGYPITTVAGTQLTEGWSGQIKAFKERFGIKVVSPTRSMRTLYRDLQGNRVVVLHIDGNVFSGGIETSFLGKSITAPRGPAHLSRVMGAPTAFAFCQRKPTNRLSVHIGPPETAPTTVADERELTRKFVSNLEKCIVEDPGQWCIFRRL